MSAPKRRGAATSSKRTAPSTAEKKKKPKSEIVTVTLESPNLMIESDDSPMNLEDVAYYLTILIKAISPQISEEPTWELLMELFEGPLSEDVVMHYAGAIRATAGSPGSKEVH